MAPCDMERQSGASALRREDDCPALRIAEACSHLLVESLAMVSIMHIWLMKSSTSDHCRKFRILLCAKEEAGTPEQLGILLKSLEL